MPEVGIFFIFLALFAVLFYCIFVLRRKKKQVISCEPVFRASIKTKEETVVVGLFEILAECRFVDMFRKYEDTLHEPQVEIFLNGNKEKIKDLLEERAQRNLFILTEIGEEKRVLGVKVRYSGNEFETESFIFIHPFLWHKGHLVLRVLH